MEDRSTSLQFAAQRVLHEQTVRRLVQRVYEQRLINNVERGAYVECMVELALGEHHPILPGVSRSRGRPGISNTGERAPASRSSSRQP